MKSINQANHRRPIIAAAVAVALYAAEAPRADASRESLVLEAGRRIERTAERTSSLDWVADVETRLRVLERHAADAAEMRAAWARPFASPAYAIPRGTTTGARGGRP